jgi:hypothetical protein
MKCWLERTSVKHPIADVRGKEGRTDPGLRAHEVNDLDFSVTRTTGITEKVSLQFRAEFFNLFTLI